MELNVNFDELMKDFVTNHAYRPKLDQSTAIRVVFDLIKVNDASYRAIVSRVGRPDKKQKAKYDEFYGLIRRATLAHFGINLPEDTKAYTPFVSLDAAKAYKKAVVSRDREDFQEAAKLAFAAYQENAQDFDRFATQAKYIEAVR